MTLFKRLFGGTEPPRQRVRVCVECGMPVAEHRSWCSILQGQIEMTKRAESRANAASGERES